MLGKHFGERLWRRDSGEERGVSPHRFPAAEPHFQQAGPMVAAGGDAPGKDAGQERVEAVGPAGRGRFLDGPVCKRSLAAAG